ncbi:MAG: hypothetical protein RBS56_02630 [Candidatus Gracilibacteria bacterium]|nr:hypothetical protein [Candidatus Gracilibacteria bacterium]
MYDKFFTYWVALLTLSSELGTNFFESLTKRFEESWVFTTAPRRSGIREEWGSTFALLKERAKNGGLENSDKKKEVQKLIRELVKDLEMSGAIRLRPYEKEKIERKLSEVKSLLKVQSSDLGIISTRVCE